MPCATASNESVSATKLGAVARFTLNF
jgi:hypothetical protein